MTVLLENLTVRYGNILAVDNISVEFPGGAVGLLGRNGAGKSTVLKALLGLVVPQAGRMRILDLPAEASPLEIRRHVGYMPERESFLPMLNGYETVRLCGELSGLPTRDAARMAHEVLYLVRLGEQRYRPVTSYSTGMRQKTKLACALVHDPAVLFLDEPTNGLDPAGRDEMLQLITQLASEFGKSVVLSSHILPDVEKVCENVALMEQGRVLAQGPLAELTQTETRDVHLETRVDEAALRLVLERAGVLAVATEDLPFSYRLTLSEDFAISAVFAAVADAGGLVIRLCEHRRSLEEVFLGAVRDAESKPGEVA